MLLKQPVISVSVVLCYSDMFMCTNLSHKYLSVA